MACNLFGTKPLGANVCKIGIKIQWLLFQKINPKISSVKCQPSRHRLNVLNLTRSSILQFQMPSRLPGVCVQTLPRAQPAKIWRIASSPPVSLPAVTSPMPCAGKEAITCYWKPGVDIMNAKFVITGGNQRCHQWWQTWHCDNITSTLSSLVVQCKGYFTENRQSSSCQLCQHSIYIKLEC